MRELIHGDVHMILPNANHRALRAQQSILFATVSTTTQTAPAVAQQSIMRSKGKRRLLHGSRGSPSLCAFAHWYRVKFYATSETTNAPSYLEQPDDEVYK